MYQLRLNTSLLLFQITNGRSTFPYYFMTNYTDIIGKREYIYKAWDYEYKNMYETVISINYDPTGRKPINVGVPLPNGNYTLHNFELLLFTGRCDKNGKKIFVGDIVNMHSVHCAIGADFGISKYLVQYRDGGACFDMLHENYLYSDRKIGTTFDSGLVRSIEIIGNYFQNPELLPNN